MIIFTKDIAEALTAYLASKNYDKTYLVTDTNTRQHCLPLLEGTPALRDAGQITIEAGDIHKTSRRWPRSGSTSPTVAPRVTHCSSTSAAAW